MESIWGLLTAFSDSRDMGKEGGGGWGSTTCDFRFTQRASVWPYYIAVRGQLFSHASRYLGVNPPLGTSSLEFW